jgi:ABC-type transporter Mla MlaB component
MAATSPRSITLRIRAPLLSADLPGLYERTCALLGGGFNVDVLLCDVAGIAADAVAVDALARLALAARRRACEVRLRGASAELLALVDFIGVADVLREWR